jgi:hypothetical protein
MRCAEFEALLTDALDGLLVGAARERFDAHRAECPNCALMYAEAESGLSFLNSLEEVEPPKNLVHNIMVATVGAAAPAKAATEPGAKWWQKWRTALRPVLGPVLQPRFAMSFAMAFFSISAVLNLSGVKLSKVTAADLRPSALRDAAVRTYYETTARAVRYYDNLRFVYEIESRVRELKNAMPDSATEPQPKPEQPKDQNHKTSEEQDQKPNHQQYSRDLSQIIVASSVHVSGAERDLLPSEFFAAAVEGPMTLRRIG